MTRLAPVDSMLEVMELVLPWPTATSAMTEAMPMTMPRTVSPDRALLAEMARKDSAKMSPSLMLAPPPIESTLLALTPIHSEPQSR